MQRSTIILTAVTLLTSVCGASVSNAAFFSLPRMLGVQYQKLQKMSFETPVLAPMGHVRFCLQYPEDCQAQETDFRRRHVALTEERWNELSTINRNINRDISPDPSLGPSTEQWKIAPSSGNCHDYAVTKRHELLERGWPSRSLLLAEVVIPSGEHHLVLVVRTKDSDFVLDNLNANIRPVSLTTYQYSWVRVESPFNPRFWNSVIVPGLDRVAMASSDIKDN